MSDTNDSDGRDYSVGYGKPPVATRFKAGNPGRRKGGSKRPKAFTGEELAEELLRRKIRVKRGDRIFDMAFREVALSRMQEMLARGTLAQVSQVMDFVQRFLPPPPVGDSRLDIVHHRAPDSTVELPSPSDWMEPEA